MQDCSVQPISGSLPYLAYYAVNCKAADTTFRAADVHTNHLGQPFRYLKMVPRTLEELRMVVKTHSQAVLQAQSDVQKCLPHLPSFFNSEQTVQKCQRFKATLGVDERERQLANIKYDLANGPYPRERDTPGYLPFFGGSDLAEKRDRLQNDERSRKTTVGEHE